MKYKFELLETALQTARPGVSVIHCPEFIRHLQNHHCKPEFQLVELPAPVGYRRGRPLKVYLTSRKGAMPEGLEGKLAKFMRSIR